MRFNPLIVSLTRIKKEIMTREVQLNFMSEKDLSRFNPEELSCDSWKENPSDDQLVFYVEDDPFFDSFIDSINEHLEFLMIDAKIHCPMTKEEYDDEAYDRARDNE